MSANYPNQGNYRTSQPGTTAQGMIQTQPRAQYISQPQYSGQQPPYNGGNKNGGKTSVSTILISSLLALLLGLGGGFLGAKLGGGGSTVIKTEDGSKVVFQEIERSTDIGSQASYAVEDVAAAVADSVVEITTEIVTTNSFLGQYISQGAGSGVIFTTDGYIVTNHHVIEGANKINVTLRNGTSYDAKLVGDDSKTDLALLKIEATGLTPAVLIADSDQLKVGQTAIAIGNPLGQLGGTVTSGIVSALGREIEIQGETMTLLQTSAAINPGNSGGGLFDDKGNLIGIVNAKSSGSDIEGLGFAIPANTVKKTIGDLMEYGYVKGRANLGLTYVTINSLAAAWLYGYDDYGVFISNVDMQSDAYAAGLQAGDMIVSINGAQIDSEEDIQAQTKNLKVGDTVNIVIRRRGKDYKVDITLTEYKG
ncbi:MAG: trypsin-like peptidase domain-containing protein [Clostridia bacterium]|nr:trypsin-like peptidase domain-containing protein [Clostridia bacterium]